MSDEKTIRGNIKGVELTNGVKKNGDPWTRASIKVERSDGTSLKVATFDKTDIGVASGLMTKEADVTYTDSADNQFHNLVKGAIKEATGEAPQQQQLVSKSQAPPQSSSVPIKSEMSKDDWAEKEKRQYRGMCVSYAKDLVVGEKLDLKKMKTIAQEMYDFIWEEKKEIKETKEEPVKEEKVN